MISHAEITSNFLSIKRRYDCYGPLSCSLPCTAFDNTLILLSNSICRDLWAVSELTSPNGRVMALDCQIVRYFQASSHLASPSFTGLGTSDCKLLFFV